ncbi:MAG: xanthine dehydrogenase family protein subunit M [Anaerolineales bacterium]|nr:xanthine dehydrogenase family protein subunit M [Anaerolineales bacterium]
MKPAPFEYVAPSSIAMALDELNQHGYGAKILAGGQSLIPVMNFRLAQPEYLIDLNNLAELDYLKQEGDVLRMGAMTRQRTIERAELIAQQAPLLHEAMPYIAHPQIRNRGTVGGSIAHADPAGELPMLAVALEGRFKLQSVEGTRWVTAADFFTDLFETEMAENEILTEIEIPIAKAKTGYAFTEMARRHGDYALCGVAAWVTLDAAEVCQAAKLVYLNAGPIPMQATAAAALLVGETPSAEVIAAAADKASQDEVEPDGDIHATAAYKRHLARVLTKKVLATAFERAKEN